MLATLLAARSYIGVDIGSARVKIAQLVRSRRGWALGACSSFARSSPGQEVTPEESQRIAEVVWRCGCEGDSVVVGVPRPLQRSAILDLPPRESGAPIDQICAAELARMYRLEPGGFEMHAWEMRGTSKRNKSTLMASTAVPHAGATGLVRSLESAGLSVRALDLGGCAAGRALTAAFGNDPELGAVLDIGSEGMDLVLLRGGEMVYHRRLEGFGVGSFVAALQRKLGLSERAAGVMLSRVGLATDRAQGFPESLVTGYASVIRHQTDALLREILAASAYALERFPGESIGAMRVAGGGARVAKLPEFMTETSGIEVRALRCEDLVTIPKRWGSHRDEPGLLAAIGHALWESAA